MIFFFISLTIYKEKVRENEQETNNKNQRKPTKANRYGISEKSFERSNWNTK